MQSHSKHYKVLQRIENERKRKTRTRHHILNKCRQDLFNVFVEGNTVGMNELEHTYHHLNNGNEHPLETLQKTERFTQVMSSKATELYQALISMSIEDFYQKRFVK